MRFKHFILAGTLAVRVSFAGENPYGPTQTILIGGDTSMSLVQHEEWREASERLINSVIAPCQRIVFLQVNAKTSVARAMVDETIRCSDGTFRGDQFAQKQLASARTRLLGAIGARGSGGDKTDIGGFFAQSVGLRATDVYLITDSIIDFGGIDLNAIPKLAEPGKQDEVIRRVFDTSGLEPGTLKGARVRMLLSDTMQRQPRHVLQAFWARFVDRLGGHLKEFRSF